MRDATSKKIRMLHRASIERAIGGQTFRFYAFRPAMVQEIIGLGGSLASSIAAIFDRGSADRGFKNRNYKAQDTAGAGEEVNEVEHLPASVDVVRFRAEQRASAAKSIAEALAGPSSQNLIARMVCDSLRDEFDEGGPKPQDAADFWSELDLGLAAEFVAGALEANAAVIRPLLARAGLNLRDEVKSALADLGPALSIVPKTEETAETT